MDISILTSDPKHPVNDSLKQWQNNMVELGHDVSIYYKKSELVGGDILFLISCSEIVNKVDREKFKAALVIHASNLPEGRGWSPHIWAILAGAKAIDICLLEAGELVDTGNIWLRERFYLEGHELLPEINKKLFETELKLMTKAVNDVDSIVPKPQKNIIGTYYSKRTLVHSKLDLNKSLFEQFNLLRVVDNNRYPAFFEHYGKRYILKIEKVENE